MEIRIEPQDRGYKVVGLTRWGDRHIYAETFSLKDAEDVKKMVEARYPTLTCN